MASSLEFARRMAKPPTSSFDSVKGPSVTLNLPLVERTRAPSALGRQPSVAISQPAFMPSSTSLPIFAMASCDGGTFFSTDLYILRNFMASSFYFKWRCLSGRPWPNGKTGSIDASNELSQNRHGLKTFFRDSASAVVPWLLLLGGGLGAQISFLLAKLGSQSGAEVLGLKDLANFDFGFPVVRIGAALNPFDGLFHGAYLPEPEAGDQLFGLGERPVRDGTFWAGEADALALGTGLETLGGEQDAGLHQLLVEFSHVGEELLAGQYAGLGVFVGFHYDHESHCCISFFWG